jgi:tRNA(Ile2) C34 agmatinyltransferase TiaS
MTTQTTTHELTCDRCGGTRFGVFAAPSGKALRCRACGKRAPKEEPKDIFARIAWSQSAWTA